MQSGFLGCVEYRRTVIGGRLGEIEQSDARGDSSCTERRYTCRSNADRAREGRADAATSTFQQIVEVLDLRLCLGGVSDDLIFHLEVCHRRPPLLFARSRSRML